jgi:polyribonucleotide nucleotidyltransferase
MDIMRKALEQARQGRLHILAKMAETLPASRKDISSHAPPAHSPKPQPPSAHWVTTLTPTVSRTNSKVRATSWADRWTCR